MQYFSHAVTTPFIVVGLISDYAKHLNQYTGVTLRVIEQLNPTRARVVLEGDSGDWNIYKTEPGVQFSGDEVIDLDELVVGFMEAGEVVVFRSVGFESDSQNLSFTLYGVNSQGESHGEDMDNSVLRINSMLGAPEEDSPLGIQAAQGLAI